MGCRCLNGGVCNQATQSCDCSGTGHVGDRCESFDQSCRWEGEWSGNKPCVAHNMEACYDGVHGTFHSEAMGNGVCEVTLPETPIMIDFIDTHIKVDQETTAPNVWRLVAGNKHRELSATTFHFK